MSRLSSLFIGNVDVWFEIGPQLSFSVCVCDVSLYILSNQKDSEECQAMQRPLSCANFLYNIESSLFNRSSPKVPSGLGRTHRI